MARKWDFSDVDKSSNTTFISDSLEDIVFVPLFDSSLLYYIIIIFLILSNLPRVHMISRFGISNLIYRCLGCMAYYIDASSTTLH